MYKKHDCASELEYSVRAFVRQNDCESAAGAFQNSALPLQASWFLFKQRAGHCRNSKHEVIGNPLFICSGSAIADEICDQFQTHIPSSGLFSTHFIYIS